MNYCGFNALKGNSHCWIDNTIDPIHCAVCNVIADKEQ